jgi:hypothetical protein
VRNSFSSYDLSPLASYSMALSEWGSGNAGRKRQGKDMDVFSGRQAQVGPAMRSLGTSRRQACDPKGKQKCRKHDKGG